MNRPQIVEKIASILSDVIDREGLTLTESTTADSVEDWDSINHVRLLMGLESELRIQFETDEVNSIKNVGGLVDIIQKKLG